MIDLTPLDVRKKRGDFGKGLRGYDPQEVDTFLELVAERLEEVVKENMTLRERAERLADQVNQQTGREKAVQDALVTAQQLRDEMKSTAEREADLTRREADGDAKRIREEAENAARKLVDDAEAEARAILRDAESKLRERQELLSELERRRERFLAGFRQLLERELEACEIEEQRNPEAGEVAVELELLGGRPEPEEAGTDAGAQPPEAEPTGDELSSDGGSLFDAPRAAGDEVADSPAGEIDQEGGFEAEGAEGPAPESSVESAQSPTETALESGFGGPVTPAAPEEKRELHPTDEGWLDEILNEEAEETDRRRSEGEW